MNSTATFCDLPFITYGTTRLGDGSTAEDIRVQCALDAMDTGLWFHTSIQYGDTLQVLGKAFKLAPKKIPKLMIKVEGSSVPEMREYILKNIQPLGVPGVEIGQLCPGGALSDEIANGGPAYRALQQLKAEGLVKQFVLEVFPWTSERAMKALQGGHLEGTVDALIFYFNPLQRFASNGLWDLILEKRVPWLALRTLGGGDVRTLAKDPSSAWMRYWHERAVEVLPIFERSGIGDWVEFCVRFAASFPGVQGTVGASSKIERVKALSDAAFHRAPLPRDILNDLLALQRHWSDEVDVKAKPWTM